MDDELHYIKERIINLEKRIDIGFSKIGLDLNGIPVNGLFSSQKEISDICKSVELKLERIIVSLDGFREFKEKTDKEIFDIKESLKGNITISGIQKFLMQIPAIFSGITLIGYILFILLKTKHG